MNKTDDILERLKGQQPVIDDPDALTERIMSNLPDIGEGTGQGKARVVGIRWRWMAIAASILLIIGMGVTLIPQGRSDEFDARLCRSDEFAIRQDGETNLKLVTHDSRIANSSEQVPTEKTPTAQPSERCAQTVSTSRANSEYDTYELPVRPVRTQDSPKDENLHYATHELTKDTLPYQDPARVDEFIAKLADYYNVKQGELTCSVPLESNVVSSVYVFPDKATSTSPSDNPQEIDIFGRLLQVACWYKSETPGYRLNFSNQQFFFELKDLRKQLQYRWIAERISGKILLYGTCAPIGAETSSACYQEYRDELTHTKSINIKTKEI